MTIDLACPGCGKSYSLPESQRGKQARCKRCGEEFRVDRPGPTKLASIGPSISPARPLMPDSIPIECPYCSHRYDVDAVLGGKRARCRSCGEVFRLPEAAAVVPTPAAPVARVATAPRVAAPAWDPERQEMTRPAWSLPPGGLGPLKVGLVAVGGCAAVIAIGVLIRAIVGGAAPQDPPKGDPPAVAGNPRIEVPTARAAAAGFDPFPDEPPGATIRDDVLRPHRSIFEGIADATERLLALLRAMDGPPDAATLAKAKAIEATIAERDGARAALPKLDATEEYRLLAEFAARLIDLGARQKAEIRRLLAVLPAGGFAADLRQQEARIDRAIGAFRKGMTAGPTSVPCVDVICPDYVDPDGLVGEAIRGRLEAMTDTAPPEVFRFRSIGGGPGGRVATGVRLGPVVDPQAFARTIRFGKIASVKGRKITVVDVRAEADDLAEARAGRSGP